MSTNVTPTRSKHRRSLQITPVKNPCTDIMRRSPVSHAHNLTHNNPSFSSHKFNCKMTISQTNAKEPPTKPQHKRTISGLESFFLELESTDKPKSLYSLNPIESYEQKDTIASTETDEEFKDSVQYSGHSFESSYREILLDDVSLNEFNEGMSLIKKIQEHLNDKKEKLKREIRRKLLEIFKNMRKKNKVDELYKFRLHIAKQIFSENSGKKMMIAFKDHERYQEFALYQIDGKCIVKISGPREFPSSLVLRENVKLAYKYDSKSRSLIKTQISNKADAFVVI